MTQPTSIETGTAPCGGPSVEISLRPARVVHVEALFELIDAASRTSTVLPRDRDSLGRSHGDFVVALDGEEVVGCASLYRWTGELAEIKSLVVTPRLRGAGLGARMVRELVKRARRRKLARVFALTEQVDFFLRQGFGLTDKETLPEKVWNECMCCPIYDNCTESAVDLDLGRLA